MRITDVDVMRVFVPWKRSFRDAMRDWRTMLNTTPEEEDAYVIIRVRTDEGIVGIGEGGRSVTQAKREARGFISQNPLDLDMYSLRAPWVHAVFDIVGQALGVPVYRLLGTKVRDHIPVAYWTPYQDLEGTRKHAEEAVRAGFTVIKIKARPWDVVEKARAIHEVTGSDCRIRIDANSHFTTVAETVRIERALRGCNIECFEDPIPKNHVTSTYPLLRQKCVIPLALHCNDLNLIFDAARSNAVDFFNTGGNLDRGTGGTPEFVLKAAAVAEAAGIPVWLQFEGHCLDVAAAFDAHLGAVIPNATMPFDTLPFLREAGITAAGMPVEKGAMQVPESPGLGVTLDDRLVTKYRIE
jgi:L-alanine-DL-glutamate epimerase-like enolase superfamily enzyme